MDTQRNYGLSTITLGPYDDLDDLHAVNRPGFDAAPFLEKDADHAQALPHRAA
ncbi:hypothetical protein ACFWDA_26230 [Rhodococcus zopfii]|uniref:hypothetical protein n=1 Tax=Rhodococcus zopfii TaxID=43772 RepID=UPI0036480F31